MKGKRLKIKAIFAIGALNTPLFFLSNTVFLMIMQMKDIYMLLLGSICFLFCCLFFCCLHLLYALSYI